MYVCILYVFIYKRPVWLINGCLTVHALGTKFLRIVVDPLLPDHCGF